MLYCRKKIRFIGKFSGSVTITPSQGTVAPTETCVKTYAGSPSPMALPAFFPILYYNSNAPH